MGLAAGRVQIRPAWGTRARAAPGGDARSGWSSHVSRVSGSNNEVLFLWASLSPPGLALHHHTPPPPFGWRRDGGALNSLGTGTRPAGPVLWALGNATLPSALGA